MSPIEYHSNPELFRGKGRVYIAFTPDFAPALHGYWDLEPDGPPTALEEMPSDLSVWEAVQWGRERAPRVLLRLDDPWGGGVHWYIGEVPSGHAEVEFLVPYPQRNERGARSSGGKRPPDAYIAEFVQEELEDDDGA